MGLKQSKFVPEVPVPIPTDNFDTYVINMDKNRARLASFRSEYIKTDLRTKPFIRFAAVNGFQLGEQIKDIVSSKVWLGLNFLTETKKRIGRDQLTPGMIGCYLSHYGIYKDILASGKPYALIFEDDAKIYPSIYQNVIQHIEAGSIFPQDWDIILLGHWCKNCQEAGTPNYKIPKYFWGTHGYMISRKGCQVMMQYREPEITLQIDSFISLLSQKNVLKIYATHPSYVSTSNFGTDIQLNVTPAK